MRSLIHKRMPSPLALTAHESNPPTDKAMTTPLSNKQKGIIAKLARKAYAVVVCHGCVNFDEFRREEQLHAVGISSLCDCTQAHYVPLYNYFAALANQKGIPDNTWSDVDKAMKRLRDAMAKQEINETYLATVAGKKHACLKGYHAGNILEAIRVKLGGMDIIKLSYTIINRGRAHTRRIATEYGLDPVTEPHAHPSTMPPGNMARHFNVEDI